LNHHTNSKPYFTCPSHNLNLNLQDLNDAYWTTPKIAHILREQGSKCASIVADSSSLFCRQQYIIRCLLQTEVH